ncbi:AmiS/UreI transporter [Acinetobacter sp. TGL-Y2]|uniref:AmiS/UreI family transporter n=1 Tax=Acinetobacter sp. TGL-Y2 TaxID=1407071 RepID=UPI0007A65E26|nr:AmiS/UreI family transporter [Acinetobacter sp. TGL-Y2]AMW78084.1 AmiS/UreI transporter [Acinetobacter sp. TGL-Y2]
MLGVALLFIGSVLLVNGLGLNGKMEARDSAPFNLLVGLLAFFINGIALYRGNNPLDYFGVAAGLLFAFTYLYLAVVQWFNLKGIGLGWYCLFVAINAFIFATLAGEYRLIVMWVLWSSLWFLFFLVLSLEKNLKFLGNYTIFIGVFTCWIPGLLMLTNHW